MNIKEQLNNWLQDHIDDNPDMFEDNLESLTLLVKSMINNALIEQSEDSSPVYDNSESYHMSGIPSTTLCQCGHQYDRHFDPNEDYAPVGCKYCSRTPGQNKWGERCCSGFKKKED